MYVLLTAPRRAYDLLPIAALVGGMAGLGMLATHSELTVMRAAGVSIGRIVWWVLKPSLVLVVAGLAVAFSGVAWAFAEGLTATPAPGKELRWLRPGP